MIKRVVVAGCRDYNNYNEAKEFIDSCIAPIKEEHTIIFVSGACRGADMLGERYASENNYQIERYPAQWAKYGKSAGPKRNKKMVEISDMIICFWDGESRGTKSTIEFAKSLLKNVKIKMI